MAAVTYTTISTCSGGKHFVLQRSGAFGGTVEGDVADYLNNPPTVLELKAAEVIFLRAHCAGLTLGQINNHFTGGVKVETSRVV